MQRVAIIGAGISGLSLASSLGAKCDVTIFEKSRGFGGRMATRRADPFAFDHGAQYFTVKSKEFKSFLEPMIESKIVQAWDAKIVVLKDGESSPRQNKHENFVAVPGMSSLGRHLAKDLNVESACEISKICREGDFWTLYDSQENAHGPFDWVVSAAPAPQTARLMPENFAQLPDVTNASLLPGFTLMLGFDEVINFPFDGAFVEGSKIGFIAINSSKPERGEACSIVVQSHNQWAQSHVNEDKEQLAGQLFEELRLLSGIDLPAPTHRAIHRWLYANVDQVVGSDFLLDEQNKLAACGDWCIAGRVESAFHSGNSLGEALVAKFDA